jgi:hypothetical protein
MKIYSLHRLSLLSQAVIFVCFAAASLADTIKFKDGTSWTGDIIRQNDNEIVMSVELSGGAISTQRTANRADVAEIILSTPEEKLLTAAERAYRHAVKFQLDPQTSYAKDYYDRVISGAFDKFLSTYTNTAHAAEIESLRSKWVEDRERVAIGQVKYHGAWKPVEEVRAQIESEQSQNAFTQARSLMSDGKLDDAIRQVLPFTGTNYSATVQTEAKGLLAEMYKLQLPQLQQRLAQVQAQLPQAKAALDKAKSGLDQATQQAKQAMPSGFKSSTSSVNRDNRNGLSRGITVEQGPRLGEASLKQVAVQKAINAARQNYAALETAYKQLQTEQQSLQARLNQASTTVTQLGIVEPSPPPATQLVVQVNEPETPSVVTNTVAEEAPEDQTVLTGITGWFKKNWIFVVLGAGALLYLVNRFAKD